MEWCGVKEGGGAELTHLSSSSPVSSSSPMSSSSPVFSPLPASSSSPVSVHGRWVSFVSRGGRCGWWWVACVVGDGEGGLVAACGQWMVAGDRSRAVNGRCGCRLDVARPLTCHIVAVVVGGRCAAGDGGGRGRPCCLRSRAVVLCRCGRLLSYVAVHCSLPRVPCFSVKKGEGDRGPVTHRVR